jgi:methionyl aminopeptidase
MAIILKSQGERAKIKRTGQTIATVFQELRQIVQPGITTGEINQEAAAILKRLGAQSSSLGYHGYPGVLCTSVNEEVIHGIPGKRVLKAGDIVTLDLAANQQGWHADSAITMAVGEISPELQRLLQVTEEALYRGIAVARPGRRVRDIGRAIQNHIEAAGYSVVRNFSGHGVGRSMHEDPDVLNYVESGSSPVLKPGMVIAIEPMVIMGSDAIRILDDDWTVVSEDGSYSAHFEHTVGITEGGAEIYTRL